MKRKEWKSNREKEISSSKKNVYYFCFEKRKKHNPLLSKVFCLPPFLLFFLNANRNQNCKFNWTFKNEKKKQNQ